MKKICDYFLNPWRLIVYLRMFVENILSMVSCFAFFRKTRNKEYPITLSIWFNQKILGYNKLAYWPMHRSSQVTYAQNVLIGKNVVPGYQHGCFIHGQNGVIIDDYTFVAPNVGIMSANHDVCDLRNQIKKNPIKIGKYCWLGMNVMILPEVELGDFTIVGAGAIVTKSFPDGHCIIAGNPAVIIRRINPLDCLRYSEVVSHIGYVPVSEYDKLATKIINNICVE